jgi:hypothetical protein
VTSLATLVVVVVVLTTAPANASPGLNARTSGTFSGGITLDFGFPCVGIGHEQAIAIVDLKGASDGALVFDVCVNYSLQVTTGTFALHTRHGTLRGTVTGLQVTASPASTLDFTLHVTRGTGVYALARGTVALDAQWTSVAGENLTGTLTPSLSTARFGR